MFHIVLLEPEIPPNTGNIARTCMVTGCKLHLIRPLGFDIDDKSLKRAGLDYWAELNWCVHDSWDAYLAATPGTTRYFVETCGETCYSDAAFQPDDHIIFGKETTGISQSILSANKNAVLRVPMRESMRSINLSSTVSIVLYEALRQNDFGILQ